MEILVKAKIKKSEIENENNMIYGYEGGCDYMWESPDCILCEVWGTL